MPHMFSDTLRSQDIKTRLEIYFKGLNLSFLRTIFLPENVPGIPWTVKTLAFNQHRPPLQSTYYVYMKYLLLHNTKTTLAHTKY